MVFKMISNEIKEFDFHILVIDDDERLRNLLKQFLEKNGFRVSDVENANAAKKIMKSFLCP